MATLDPNYRPSADQPVCIFGELTDELVNKVAVDILRLRELRRPITVLINSPGGAIHCLDYIHGLLTTRTAFGNAPQLITVAVGDAKSAAATLLCLGNYAIAYPRASIHFHGVRYGAAVDVTVESASTMAAQLESQNRSIATRLARAVIRRLAFHYARLKGEFEETRRAVTNSSFSDIECFAFALKARLSESGDRIVDRAIERWQYLQRLSEKTIAIERKSGRAGVPFQSSLLQRIIRYEVKRNKINPEWQLDEAGIRQIMLEFLLLRDYDMGGHNQLVQT